MLPQKMASTFFFMSFLHKFEKRDIKILSTLASTSFAVFFFHGYVLLIIKRLINLEYLAEVLPSGALWIVTFLASIFITILCVFITLLIKKIFKKYSRYLIGA